jgi:dihydroorotase
MHPVWRDAETAIRSTKNLLRLARETGRAVHVLHVTTGEELALLAEHKDIATVEVTPQHLFFAAPECYERLGSLAQMNPPIREARHRDALVGRPSRRRCRRHRHRPRPAHLGRESPSPTPRAPPA